MSTSLPPLLAPMLSSPAMRAVCDDVTCLQHMLDFEAALARAEAATGVIPATAAGSIGKACKAGAFDLAALAEAATRSGNIAIPLVKALTADVAKADADAARYVHSGATSHDVLDTGATGGVVAERLVQERRLPLGCAPWDGRRERVAEAASVFGIVAGTCGEIARDMQLMMQTDVAEAFEPAGEGRGGSSTMPHKRNPRAAPAALAAATLAPGLAATGFASLVHDHQAPVGP